MSGNEGFIQEFLGECGENLDQLDQDPQLRVIGIAADGRIALDKVRQEPPDVILLDIEMPNMDGLETLKTSRQTHPRLRNVVVYFKPEAEKQILQDVRKQLKPDGYLFLGGAETTIHLDSAFTNVHYKGYSYCQLH